MACACLCVFVCVSENNGDWTFARLMFVIYVCIPVAKHALLLSTKPLDNVSTGLTPTGEAVVLSFFYPHV